MDRWGLWEPDAVAVFCDSESEKNPGHIIASNIVDGNFPGEIVIVDSMAQKLHGIPCIKDPRDFHRKIDLAILTIYPDGPDRSDELYKQVDRSIMAGAKSIILVSKPLDTTTGKKLSDSIQELCTARSVRLVGPSSLGVINRQLGLNASITNALPPPGGVALISESGSMTLAILERLEQSAIGVSKVIDLGMKMDLDEVDLFKVLATDDNTSLVIAYLESITSGNGFLKRAESLARSKPLIVFKAGTSHAGQQAALEHSGRVSQTMAYGAAFRRAGIVQAGGIDSLIDLVAAFDSRPLPVSDEVQVVTDTVDIGILTADTLERSALHLSGFVFESQDSSTQSADIYDGIYPETSNFSGAILHVIAPDLPGSNRRWTRRARDFIPRTFGPVPIFTTFMGALTESRREELKEFGPLFSSPERAVAAIEAMRSYAKWRARPTRVITRFRVNRRRVERILRRHERNGYRWIHDYMARQILASYDFKTPQCQLVDNIEAAVEIAERMGYPVTVSAVSFQILDKYSVGATRKGLVDADSVRDAYDLIMLRLERHLPEVQIDGVLVEKDVKPRLDVVIGMVRDQQFGPLLMFGHTTAGTRIMKDATYNLAPITADEARQMLLGTPAWNQLQKDWTVMESKHALDAVAGGLQRISQLATDFTTIQELEINPFSFDLAGSPPMAIHARIVLAGDQANEPQS